MPNSANNLRGTLESAIAELELCVQAMAVDFEKPQPVRLKRGFVFRHKEKK